MEAFLCLIISLVAIQIAESSNCTDPHSEWRDCGSACPDTCDTAGKEKICTMQCVPGCFCKKPYVQSKRGCILPEKCKEKELSTDKQSEECSGDNEQYNECGTACPLTCDNYQNPPILCTLQCAIGCECKEGYVKNVQGQCVLPKFCPSISSNFNLCELPSETGMCRNYLPRYHFNKASGKCKKFIYGGCGGNANNFKTREECQSFCAVAASNSICGANQEWPICGTACPLTCENLDNPPIGCSRNCAFGCQCQKGYVKNADGECVLPEECPSRDYRCSDSNSQWSNCGSACPDTCDNIHNAPICTQQCKRGCFCNPPFIASKWGCVLPRHCPRKVVM